MCIRDRVTVFEVDRGKTGKSQQQVNDKINDSQFPLDQDKAYKVLIEKEGYMPAEFEFNTVGVVAVSYTHLTLPTSDLV